MFFHFKGRGTLLEVSMLSGAFRCLSKHQSVPLSTTVSILENMPKKWPLCRSDVMFSLLYMSIGTKRADFGAIGRFVNLLMVAEVEDDDDPTSELSYETVYHTPIAIAGLLEDVPNRLVPIGDLVITPGSFDEEVRDGDEDSDQRLESVTLQVTERVLEEDKNNTQVVCVSHDH